jgi:hypothetical protein
MRIRGDRSVHDRPCCLTRSHRVGIAFLIRILLDLDLDDLGRNVQGTVVRIIELLHRLVEHPIRFLIKVLPRVVNYTPTRHVHIDAQVIAEEK